MEGINEPSLFILIRGGSGMLAVGKVWYRALACSPEVLEASMCSRGASQGFLAIVNQVEM